MWRGFADAPGGGGLPPSRDGKAPIACLDRSLRPEFWRIPASVRGSEPRRAAACGFRAASGAARKRCGSERSQRWHVLSQRVACRGGAMWRGFADAPGGSGLPPGRDGKAPIACLDRSLRPEFWRIPASVRGSEPRLAAACGFRAASGAARKRCGSERSQRRHALPQQLNRHSGGMWRGFAEAPCGGGLPPGGDSKAPIARCDRSLRPEFWRIPASVRGSEPRRAAACGFRAASGAARKRCGSERSQRWHVLSQRVACRGGAMWRGFAVAPFDCGQVSRRRTDNGRCLACGDRSLRPEFWRIPASVRGSESVLAAASAFRAASGAAPGAL
jgi:hypothetical protein